MFPCQRCVKFDVMILHARDCHKPLVKFIVCLQCQCLSVTLTSYVAHVAGCLNLDQDHAPAYVDHIIKFDEPPQIVVCDICGIYKQKVGSIFDTHRRICARFILEHDAINSR